jgi:hypothetical protein
MITKPILVIAYNRPKTLGRQLARIESLNRRNVVISIDGAKTNQEESHATIKTAENWALQSKHDVNLLVQHKNFGIYLHLPSALNAFFAKFDFGTILEDDIEFIPTFFELMDSKLDQVYFEEFWSICGHNPSEVRNPSHFVDQTLNLYPSIFHSIWGWSTTAQNAEHFSSNYQKLIDFDEMEHILGKTARKLTRDPLLRNAFISTWKRKLSGWNSKRPQSSWDTRWVYEGWKSEKFSLIPSFSLSREDLNQSEGQTHPHSSKGEIWDSTLSSDLALNIKGRNNRLDISLLRTWGIGRRYSWLYAGRVARQRYGA